MATIFEQLDEAHRSGDKRAILKRLIDHLRQHKRFHELFEARKLLIRFELGLPLLYTQQDEALAPDVRDSLEAGLIDACREVGLALLSAGRLRDAWHYLRAVGDRDLIEDAFANVTPTDENLDEFIELCVQEGLDLHRGFQAMLAHYGICNTITTFESAMYGRPRAERAIGARLLVETLYEELVEHVKGHIQREVGTAPPTEDLSELMTTYPNLLEGGAYHVDTTHLASVVRFARDLDSPQDLRLARQLIDYGRLLDPSLQYPGEPPFEDLYVSTGRYIDALLDNDRDDHLLYFRERAEATNPREETTLVIETYIDLLARTGHAREAMQESLRLLPEGIHTTGRAPSLLELAQAAGDYEPLRELSERRKDPLGYAMSLLQASQQVERSASSAADSDG